MIHNDKRMMMEIISNPRVRITDNDNVILFELEGNCLEFHINSGICNFYRQGVPSSRFAVHRYMVLVALKRVIEETIQQI